MGIQNSQILQTLPSWPRIQNKCFRGPQASFEFKCGGKKRGNGEPSPQPPFQLWGIRIANLVSVMGCELQHQPDQEVV